MKKRILGLLMAFVMVFSVCPVSVFAASDVYKETGDYLENQAKQSAPTVNSIGGEWIVIGLARSGRSVPSGYYDNVVSYVESKINDSSQLHRSKSTENSRVILALTAEGYDVTNVAGYNLLAGLTSMTYLEKQGINGPIWALIAFDSHDYGIPNGDGTVTRDLLIETILNARLSDGGWNLSATAAESDPDMTGMALQALAPYYNSKANVKKAVDEALVCLSNAQNSDGGYSSSGDANSESVVQVIVALTALGINPDSDSRFVKNGNSVLDALYTYALDGGGFEHIKGEGINQMATEQGYYALTAYERMKSGKTSLYDMTDVKLKADIEAEEAQKEADKKAASEVDKKIEGIGTVTLDSESKIKEARSAYNGLTEAQKGYVTKLGTLEAAEKKLEELKKAAAEEEEKEQQIAKDKEAAAAVDKKIEGIGTVTLDSESKIKEARSAYKGLTEAQKGYVTKLGTLEAAEKKLAELKQAAADKEEKSGWQSVGNEWYYYEQGKAVTGWQMIDDSWYYFEKDGKMVTGWLKEGDKKYYFDSAGVMKTGWLKLEENWYYFDSAGTMKTGWLSVKNGEEWYFFAKEGRMLVGEWLEDAGKTYYFDISGKMKTGWLRTGEGEYYYFDNAGAMKTGWLKDGEEWYYFHEDGVLAVDEWIEDSYVNADGIWVPEAVK